MIVTFRDKRYDMFNIKNFPQASKAALYSLNII